MKVLLVDITDPEVAALRRALDRGGYVVADARDTDEARTAVDSGDYDVLVTRDAAKAGALGSTPGAWVLLLADAPAIRPAPGVAVLDAPFSTNEFVRRVGLLCKRSYAAKASRLSVGDLTLMPATRSAERAGEDLRLTRNEYRLLEYLVRRRGHDVTRDEIEAYAYIGGRGQNSTAVQTAICALRKKVTACGRFPELIRTRRGAGYTIAA